MSASEDFEDFKLEFETMVAAAPPTKAALREAAKRRHYLNTVGRMYERYGLALDECQTCGLCAFLVRQGGTAGRYLKCRKSRITRGPATDWRAGWRACGAFQEGRGGW